MIHPDDLRLEVIRPTLRHIGLWSLAAEELLLGTAIAESTVDGRTHLVQLGGGPALSPYQIEPATFQWLWEKYVAADHDFADRLLALRAPLPEAVKQLVSNLALATAFCRLRYFVVPAALPAPGDLEAQAAYWKNHYNTAAGAGTVAGYILKVRPYL